MEYNTVWGKMSIGLFPTTNAVYLMSVTIAKFLMRQDQDLRGLPPWRNNILQEMCTPSVWT